LANPSYHLILHWRRHLANPRRDDVSLLRVSFNSTLESLPLQLYSRPLTSNSFAIDRVGNLPISCALDLIPSSLFFGDDDYIGDDVWLLRVSFNSTLESLPYLCSQPLAGNKFAIDRLGNLPGRFLCS
jgi:hypothetical protein